MKKIIISIFIAVLIVTSLFSLKALSIRDVTSTPEEIAPGEVAEIAIKIKNDLNDNINNLNIRLELSDTPTEQIPFAPYQSSSEKFLDVLGGDESEVFIFKIIALPTANSGIYKIPLTMDYYDDNDTKQPSKEETISLIVNTGAELKVFAEDSKILIKGRENTLSIKIINSGLADIKLAYLSVKEISGLKFLSEKEQYVGDINSDDFDVAEYSVYIDSRVSGTITLPLTLRYKDATNKEFTENRNLILKVYSPNEAQALGLMQRPNYFIYAGVIIVIGGFIFYRIRKKRKLKALKN